MPQEAMRKLVAKLMLQRDIKIDYRIIAGADHFFQNALDELGAIVEAYVAGAQPQPAARGD